ncbi:MAG: Mrp/NBP35 family ATP-binding protein [Erysipelotrichaceae bacterium]|nr:Mrp/NBP35 family ATP-binding protein [Erysipelotrichaceae bacterium]
MAECNHDCNSCNEECDERQGCSHDCSSCGQNCSERIEMAKPLEDVKIGKIVAVLSGKGGVGKSMVTSLLAVELAQKGYKVGIMDADITGPSIPKMFNLNNQLYGDETGIFPAISTLGIEVVSINMMLENEDVPVLWRGPILGGVIKQFYSEVHWGELDYLLIDMPPGTSDVAISIIQQIPVDSFVMVTTPSKLVSMVVGKAINMAKQVNKQIIGLVENMAYVKCDECGHEINIYKDDVTQEIADKYGLDVVGKLPIDPVLANLSDDGDIESYDSNLLDKLIDKLTK